MTQGIDLSTQSIGLKAPDFSSLHAIQNARIDVANALDLAVTLRNIVTADISTIKVRREFCETSILLLSQIQDYLSTPNIAEHPDHLYQLMDHDFLGDAPSLAEDAQLETLHNFKTAKADR